MWLVAVGHRGATVEELATTISGPLDVKLNVTKALEIMNDKGWIEQCGNDGNRFRVKARAIGKDSRAYAHMRGALRTYGATYYSIDLIDLFLQNFRDIENRNQKNTKKVSIKRKVGVRSINSEQDPALEDKCCKSGINKSEKPQEIKIRRLKIRPQKTSMDQFRKMVDKDHKIKYHGPGIRYTNMPSQYPHLNEWRNKKNPNRWTGLDWCGYWLAKWLQLYGQEDPNFCGQRCPRSTGDSLDVYRELGLTIIRLRDSGRGFKGDGVELREYLDWLFDEFLPAATWMKTPIISATVFRVKNNTFLNQFRVRSVRVKTKSKEKWNPWGMSRE